MESDLTGLHHLVNSGYRGDSSRQGWTTEADFLGGQRIDRERLKELVDDPSRCLLCFETRAGELLGTVTLERIEATKDSKSKLGCYLGMLTIDPRTQGRGLGRRLLEGAEVIAARWGAQYVKLTVIQLRTELMDWYERRGYVQTGEIEDFPYGDIRFGEPTRQDLHFVVFKKMLAP